MKEIWKKIKGLRYHEVSNFGRVRVFENTIIDKNGRKINMPMRILRGSDNGLGYRRVVIKEDGVVYQERYVHRLVAIAFIDNPYKKPCVNHIDNNPANNRADNLEWVTKQENTNWMVSQGRNKRTKEWLDRLHKTQKKYMKPVIGINIKTGETVRYESVNSTKHGGFSPASVSCCINGKQKEHKGYTWERAS